MYRSDSTSVVLIPIKQEVIEITPSLFEDSIFYCRCCFQIIDPSAESNFHFESIDKVVRAFEDMIQLTLLSSPLASHFCDECFNRISSYEEFKRLALEKQKKFNEILLKPSQSNDFTEIHKMKMPLAPPPVCFKNEPEAEKEFDYLHDFKCETDDQNDDANDEDYDPLTSKAWWQSSKVLKLKKVSSKRYSK